MCYVFQRLLLHDMFPPILVRSRDGLARDTQAPFLCSSCAACSCTARVMMVEGVAGLRLTR